MPCTTIVIRHSAPIVSIIVDAAEIRAATQRDGNYSMQRAINRDRL